MAVLGCQFGYIWNEWQSRIGGHTCGAFSVWFEVSDSSFNLDLWGRKTRTFGANLKTWRHTHWIQRLRWEDIPLIWAKPSAPTLHFDHDNTEVYVRSQEKEGFSSLPTCPCLARTPLLASKPASFAIQTYGKGQLRYPALWDWTASRFLGFPSAGSLCWIRYTTIYESFQ